MKHNPAWLAAGLLVFVVLACSAGKNANKESNSNSNSNTSRASEAEDAGSGVFIKEIHMAKDDNGKPGSEADSFEPGDRTIHCVATLKDSKSGTAMRFSWWIVDADGTTNRKIKDIDYSTRAMENIIHGHLTAPNDWPKGKFKVQVYVNGDLDKTAFYTVD